MFNCARKLCYLACSALLLTLCNGSLSFAQTKTLLLQSTTSTLNSGLYNWLLPQFTSQTGITVRVVAVGTGKALANGRNCNGDVLLIHSTADEIAFVAQGYGQYRQDVMYNDFIVIGPQDDPAGIATKDNASAALKAILQAQTPFASRADNSGTHKAEKRLWQMVGLNPKPASGTWYLETGTGMGATLNLAVEKQAYTITDRATWIAFANKQEHKLLLEGDETLFNQYGVIPISQTACPSAKADLAKTFADWLVSKTGQEAIASYQKTGIQLFVPNARPKDE